MTACGDENRSTVVLLPVDGQMAGCFNCFHHAPPTSLRMVRSMCKSPASVWLTPVITALQLLDSADLDRLASRTTNAGSGRLIGGSNGISFCLLTVFLQMLCPTGWQEGWHNALTRKSPASKRQAHQSAIHALDRLLFLLVEDGQIVTVACPQGVCQVSYNSSVNQP